MSNECCYDCAYCINRRSNPIERATLTVEELVSITINFYRRNYIEGLFLSSGVYAGPVQTAVDMIRVVEELRYRHAFHGYVHLKIIPGIPTELVERAGRVADRLSVNIELPSERSLRTLAPQKDRNGILKPMAYIGDGYRNQIEERRRKRRPPPFAPAGQSTQMIIGASDETDRHILKLSESLYSRNSLRRVYYSAYVPVNDDSRLPVLREGPPLRREHRLYQADWLFRFYDFTIDELLDPEHPNLDPDLDPKAAWALRNSDLFPVDLNRAPYEMLLRIPGIGVRSAQKIVETRRVSPIRFDDLPRIGLVMKRARHFISINGKSADGILGLRSRERTVSGELKSGDFPVLAPSLIQPSLFEIAK
jgi:putative DNA modification/repair radical SAM protein